MNIFYLHPHPRHAARMHCDKHVIKMILEYTQILSTVHHQLDTPNAWRVYKPTHVNHPSTRWTAYCRENYIWLFRCLNELHVIYTDATARIHKSKQLMPWFLIPPSNLPFATDNPNCVMDDMELTSVPNVSPMPQCMPECYKQEKSAVLAYRNYYMHEKSYMATFTYNPQPDWYVARSADAKALDGSTTRYLANVPDSLATTKSQARKHVHKPRVTKRPVAPYKSKPKPATTINGASLLPAPSGRNAVRRPVANSLSQLQTLFNK